MIQVLRLFFFAVLLAFAGCAQQPSTGESDTVTPSQEDDFYGGLALYTLGDIMAGDPHGVLRQMADLGYEYLEAAGHHDGKFYGVEMVVFKA